MPPDWSQVTAEHVRRACKLYDSGTVPGRPAKSTFLLLNGKTYPAKFIRGLAYRLATGVELNPSRDYAGGLETARFFQRLGLPTQPGSQPTPTSPTAIVVQPPPQAEGPLSGPPRRRLEPQKQALADLLRRRFGSVVTEAEFPWLTVPHPGEMDATITGIYQALQGMRGHSNFAAFGRSLRCDFFVPSERLVIEFDERQHFTLPRAEALRRYPPEVALGFDREEWIATCRSVRAMDPSPPYRDEQRAFYDSLRDILAARNGIRLARLRHGTVDWTGRDGNNHLTGVLSGLPLSERSMTPGPSPTTTADPLGGTISRLALVSHDYNVPGGGELFDYSEHFHKINKLCDEQGCDTILYALYTLDRNSVSRNHDSIFGGLAHVRTVVVEVGEPAVDSFDHVEVWLRGRDAPAVAKQRFATSTAPDADKRALLDDLDERRIGEALLLICGETNIASLVRGSDEFYDAYHFADLLRDMRVRVVLNPVHDYMRRYEMRAKRRYFSLGGRTVISVWNQGKGKESRLPWTVFHDGAERTDAVRELPRHFADRPDIRIGVVDLSALGGDGGP